MEILKKLAKADKLNEVTKKDGNLTAKTIDAIKLGFDGKFYTCYTSGSGRFTTNLHNERVKTICRLLGYKYYLENDAPMGGKTGNYINVSKKAFNNIKSLIN
jgi:hypothetical protein